MASLFKLKGDAICKKSLKAARVITWQILLSVQVKYGEVAAIVSTLGLSLQYLG